MFFPHGQPRNVAIAFAGPADETGRVYAAPTVWGDRLDRPVDLRRFLKDDWPESNLQILNDVTAAGYRYLRHATDDLCITTVGSGIGNKVFLDGVPRTGPNGRGGEIGHIRVDDRPGANRCECGGVGHLGGIGSGRGTLATAKKLAHRDLAKFERSSLANHCDGSPLGLRNEHIVQSFRGGDEWTMELLRQVAMPLAQVFATIHLAIGVERFVVYGGFGIALGEGYRQLLVDAASCCCWDVGQEWSTMIELGVDDDLSGLIGAGRAAMGFSSSKAIFDSRLAIEALQQCK